MHEHDCDLYKKPRSNISIPIESPYITSHVITIVTYTISVIVCKIITYERSNYRRYESLTLNEKVKVMRCNVADDMNG